MEGNKQGAFELLDNKFVMNTGYECLNCPYESICWMGADPMDESNWKPRVPNHILEAELLIKEEVR